VNVYLKLWLMCLLMLAICCCRLCLFRILLDAFPFCFLQYTALPAFCNCILFFYLEFTWGGAPPPVSCRACHTSAAVTSLPFSKHNWGGGDTPAFSGWLIYSSNGECPSPILWWSMPHFSHCYKPFPLQAYWGMWYHTRLLWPACLFTVL
jgi:hypothetical protein